MSAFEISEKICFFVLLLAFLGKFLTIFKKISCHCFSFFVTTILGLKCFQGLYQVSYHFSIVFGLGKNNVAAKKTNWAKKAIWKKRFLGFTPKSLPILDFGVQHQNNAKIQPITKSQNFSKCFITFCQLFNLRILVRNFLDHWHYFFILITSKDVVGRRCENVLQLSDFFVFGTGDMIFDMWKMTKTLLKINKFVFVLSKKFSQFLYKYFHKLWDLGNIFCAEWIFLTCL